MNSTGTNTSNASESCSGPSQNFGRPPLMHGPAPDPFENPPASGNRHLMVAGIAVGLGLTIVGLGFAFGGRSSAAPTGPAVGVAPAPSMFDEQRQMMREAMDMAKEARAAQREHMEKMRQAMEEERNDSR